MFGLVPPKLDPNPSETVGVKGWAQDSFMVTLLVFTFSSRFVPQDKEKVLGLQHQVTSEVASEVSAEL